MKLNGLHLLLTYQCTFECDHCFVWGSPFQTGTMTLTQIRHVLEESRKHDSMQWIYFEGGEPTLYYPILLKAVQEAHLMGFQVGVVSNAFWASNLEDALTWLSPLKTYIQDFSVSSDLYHYDEIQSQQASNAVAAAEELDIPVGVISIAQPQKSIRESATGQLPVGESDIMYRGRAAEKLSQKTEHSPWRSFTTCPYEDLIDPGRIHIDPLGYMHICQGISIGNLFQQSLVQILEAFDPQSHPIIGPLLSGGPAQLAQDHGVQPKPAYADACHLCYDTRLQLRDNFPEILTPDQIYGVLQ